MFQFARASLCIKIINYWKRKLSRCLLYERSVFHFIRARLLNYPYSILCRIIIPVSLLHNWQWWLVASDTTDVVWTSHEKHPQVWPGDAVSEIPAGLECLSRARREGAQTAAVGRPRTDVAPTSSYRKGIDEIIFPPASVALLILYDLLSLSYYLIM